MKIAIIGSGVSGISVVKFFTKDKRFNESFEIDVYDAPKTMGRGYAYQEDDEHLIINLPAEEMSLTDEVDDYTDWLKQAGYKVESYTSRKLFGEYMHSSLMAFVSKYSNISLIMQYVDNVIFDEDTKTYLVKSGDIEKTYDAVFLMTGELGYSDPYKLKGEKNYYYNPYPLEDHLNHLEGKIGIIGSGLSAIDSFRYLLKYGHKQVYVLSRSGEMPAVRGTHYDFSLQHLTLDKAFEYEKDGLIPLDKLLELFKKELAAHQIEISMFDRKVDRPQVDLQYDLDHLDSIGRIQYLIYALEDNFKTLFKYLSREDKQRYLEKYHPYLESNHSPMPPDGAKKILQWVDEGKLVFMHDMESVETGDGFTVTFEDGSQEHFDILINATGPVMNIEKDSSTLIQNLYNGMLVEPDEFGGVLVTKQHEIISPRYGTLPKFYTMGALTFGSDYLIKGVAMLSSETAELVNHLFKTYKN